MSEVSAPPSGALRDERRVVTVLVADLVGSTSIADRLGAEDARLIVGEAVARTVQVVERYGGTVKDLAGDGVLALFGAPQAHEDDAERALRAGLEIAADIRGYADEVAAGWGVTGFGVRVAVNTGEVVVGGLGAGERVEYAAFGDTVNTCARLQALADPGSVLVGASTRLLAEPLFTWGERVWFPVRGRAEPVEACQVLEVVAAGARHGSASAPLVGRERELELGREVVEAVLAGSGGILVVEGEPGVGKSRLAVELRRLFEAGAAGERTPCWLEGRCVSYGESMPYWPIRDLLRGWLGIGLNEPDLRARVALRRALRDLAGDDADPLYPYLGTVLGLALEPDARTRIGELSPEALQYRTFEVVREWLALLARDRPVALLLEDLHWVDSTSLALLERLFELLEEAAVLFVLTARPEPGLAWGRLRTAAAADQPHRFHEISLQALSGAATDELLEALVDQSSLPDAVRERVRDAGEGNPFFLEELLRSLADTGALAEQAGRLRFVHDAPVELPATVEQVVRARIDRLDRAGHDVLVAASVIGRRFGLDLLSAVLGGIDPVQPLRELQRLDLVREERRWPEPEYRFKHALIQEGAYRSLVRADRRALHARAAEWLERRYAGGLEEVYGLLAHHWLRAEDDDAAVRYLALAGDRARRNWALDEAIEYDGQLVELLERRGDAPGAAAVLFKLALALHTSMRFEEANRAYGRAFAMWPTDAQPVVADETLRIATTYVPRVPDPAKAGWWADIRLGMQLFDRLVEAGPERTILPALARSWEIAADGLTYRFHLREGLCWSDGTALTAGDVEYAIRRVLDPDSPGASVAVYFVLEGAREYFHRDVLDPAAIGVHAVDPNTVEFRLAAPAPYFMSVVNRADAAPLPRHAIERDPDHWTEPGVQPVSGPFEQVERTADRVVLRRRDGHRGHRGNVRTVEFQRASLADALASFDSGDTDLVPLVYSPRVADHLPAGAEPAAPGPATWTAYLAFRQDDPWTGRPELRRALAYAVDRDRLAGVLPAHLPVARGGIVPPALQGHTADIALPYRPDAAAAALAAAGCGGIELTVAFQDVWEDVVDTLAESWRELLGITVRRVRWRADDVADLGPPARLGHVYIGGWLPGYPDPEYCLRLLLQSDALTNEGGIADPQLDELIDRARRQTTGVARLELFHEVDRLAVADRAVLIPLCYGRNVAFVAPAVAGWWEFGKSCAGFADLTVARSEG
jgi:ABC-type transport system substrate-binding protein/class 3 adenylate cyclase